MSSNTNTNTATATTTTSPYPLQGGCICGTLRYTMLTAPMKVHVCHCTWCQRETGTVFATNAMIEASRVELSTPPGNAPLLTPVPTVRGSGPDNEQVMTRCPKCYVVVWSTYGSLGPLVYCVKVGTLDRRDVLSPGAHIYTAYKQAWLPIPEGMPAVEETYDKMKRFWEGESLERLVAVMKLTEELREKERKKDVDG